MTPTSSCKAEDNDQVAKRDRARGLIRELMRERSGRLSQQILAELFSAGARKPGLTAVEVRRRVELYARFDVVTLGSGDVLGAIDLHRPHQLSICDALVLRAALITGCRTLLTEDLHHGFRVDGLEVVDPFRA